MKAVKDWILKRCYSFFSCIWKFTLQRSIGRISWFLLIERPVQNIFLMSWWSRAGTSFFFVRQYLDFSHIFIKHFTFDYNLYALIWNITNSCHRISLHIIVISFGKKSSAEDCLNICTYKLKKKSIQLFPYYVMSAKKFQMILVLTGKWAHPNEIRVPLQSIPLQFRSCSWSLHFFTSPWFSVRKKHVEIMSESLISFICLNNVTRIGLRHLCFLSWFSNWKRNINIYTYKFIPLWTVFVQISLIELCKNDYVYVWVFYYKNKYTDTCLSENYTEKMTCKLSDHYTIYILYVNFNFNQHTFILVLMQSRFQKTS